MGLNYNPRRSRNVYDPASDKPFNYVGAVSTVTERGAA